MYCGDDDILFEDNVRYLELLMKNKVDCFLKIQWNTCFWSVDFRKSTN